MSSSSKSGSAKSFSSVSQGSASGSGGPVGCCPLIGTIDGPFFALSGPLTFTFVSTFTPGFPCSWIGTTVTNVGTEEVPEFWRFTVTIVYVAGCWSVSTDVRTEPGSVLLASYTSTGDNDCPAADCPVKRLYTQTYLEGPTDIGPITVTLS